jgi:hypothetical protein
MKKGEKKTGKLKAGMENLSAESRVYIKNLTEALFLYQNLQAACCVSRLKHYARYLYPKVRFNTGKHACPGLFAITREPPAITRERPNVKRFIPGTYHGLDGTRFHVYPDGYRFRGNRRFFAPQLFDRFLYACSSISAIIYKMPVSGLS